MTDRRSYDPYAPPPAPASQDDAPPTSPETDQAAQTGQGSEAARDAAEQIPADLNDITKDDLIALAELADVASWGTKPQIAQRIRDAANGIG